MNEIVLLQNKAEQTGEGELFELFLKCCHVCKQLLDSCV